jgi:hypothetical protein
MPDAGCRMPDAGERKTCSFHTPYRLEIHTGGHSLRFSSSASFFSPPISGGTGGLSTRVSLTDGKRTRIVSEVSVRHQTFGNDLQGACDTDDASVETRQVRTLVDQLPVAPEQDDRHGNQHG